MMHLESQDWDELVKLLQEAEESLAAYCGNSSEEEMEKSRRSIVSFHTTAAMLGREDLEKAGLEFENFLTGNVSPGKMDSIAVLGFAISSVIDQMRASTNGDGRKSQFDFSEILEMLKPPEDESPSAVEAQPVAEPPPVAETPEAVQSRPEEEAQPAGEPDYLDAAEAAHDFAKLSELAKSWGCDLAVEPDGDSGTKFCLTFSGSTQTMKTIEKLLGSSNPSPDEFRERSEEVTIESLIEKGKEFINTLAQGDMEGAQTVLLKLADQQRESSGLYKEIGSLARGLHDSIRSFLSTLDPSLHEIVKDKIPDSGNRLEHILEMTEKAAITTLDHVENMQERLSGEMGGIASLRGLLGGLMAIGDSSGKKLGEAAQTLNDMEALIDKNRADLDVILTAQDYQDLSGQIILKVTQLLKDIETKLVGLIRTFGVKTETARQKDSGELYGPAHAAVENAVHSQDEVDSLLADFGF